MTRRRVYFNLHAHEFSVKDHSPGSESYGRVLKHARNIVLSDCTFVISQAGYSRFMREGVKNVHAYIQGYEAPITTVDVPTTEITYNPRIAPYFRVRDTNERVDRAGTVICSTQDGIPRLLAVL